MAGATQRNAWHVVQVTLFSSYANVMLVFVFLGILAGARGWEPSAVFLLNFLAIFPLASLLSFATEELSKSVGQTVGGLINATFGNAVEMIVSRTLFPVTRRLVTVANHTGQFFRWELRP